MFNLGFKDSFRTSRFCSCASINVVFRLEKFWALEVTVFIVELFYLQKDQRKLDSLRYNSFKEIPYVIFLSCGSFYVKLANQTVLALGLFSWWPVSQIQPSIIFIAFQLKLMKLLCDQRLVQYSVVVFGAELEVKSIVQSGAPVLIV